MARKFLLPLLAVILTVALVMPGCTAPATAPDRTEGFWLDEIVIGREPEESKGVTRLAAGDFDVFAATLDDRDLFDFVVDDPNLWYKEVFGSFNTLRLNPYGPEFDDGSLNPFYYAEIREAFQRLIDRDYIAFEIMGGAAVPKYTPLNKAFGDYERYKDTMAALEAEYAYDFDRGFDQFQELMVDLAGATWDAQNEQWLYKGAPVTMKLAIREDDPKRKVIGDYIGSALEDIGFKVEYKYGDMAKVLSGLTNIPAEITGGGWNIYTGGFSLTVTSRDEGWWFIYFHTDLWQAGIPAFKYLVAEEEFNDACWALLLNTFTTLEERRDLFETALWGSMENSAMIYLVDTLGFAPLRTNVDMAGDTAGGIYGSWMWPYTAHFRNPRTGAPIFGGTLRVAMHDLLVDPWNPVAGSNAVYDMFPIRATGDMGTHPDTRDGLRWPGRIEKAEYYVKKGLPVGTSPGHDWVTLKFEDSITVPGNVWAEWDATSQRFITAAERGTAGDEATTLSVAYYPKDIFDVPLHDGSTLSMGDFIMFAIMQFDRAKLASVIYDPGCVAGYEELLAQVLGFEFITNDPNYGLIVKTWLGEMQMDAEIGIWTWFPTYAQGPGFWHTVTLGVMAETDRLLAFSDTKAATDRVAWTSFIAGESLPILRARLNTAKAENYIPYGPTLGQYITEAEAAERWSNLDAWYADMGHFWVASGPYYLHSVDTTAKSITLRPFEDYPDPRDRWLFLLD